MDVQWTDSEGRSGTVEYRGEFHDQDFYYPAWAADTYTLRGTLLESRNMVDDRGFWINRPYEWGYADNYGSDCLAGGDAMDGKGQSNGFRIANAMQPDGTPVELKYIDFVKVQVGGQCQERSAGRGFDRSFLLRRSFDRGVRLRNESAGLPLFSAWDRRRVARKHLQRENLHRQKLPETICVSGSFCTACGRSLRVPFTALKASGGNPRRNRGSWCGI